MKNDRKDGRPLYNGNHIGAVPRGYKPPRDPGIKIKNVVACPDCKAAIGDPCRSMVNGRPASTYHTSRRRLAARIHNEGA